MTIPGVGPIVSLSFVALVDYADSFSKSAANELASMQSADQSLIDLAGREGSSQPIIKSAQSSDLAVFASPPPHSCRACP